ncbi:succinate dehydrogenase [Actibacterium sp. D379-3]
MRAAFALAAAVALPGCLTTGDVAQAGSRSAAKAVVNTVVADTIPGANVEAYTDCILDHASTSQILDLAGAAVTGVDEATVDVVLDIAAKPGTIKCIAEDGLAPLLG